MGALTGLGVVDLTTNVAGPYCGKLLADLGASVVKVEPPDGDPLRQWGPFPGNVADPERSGLHHYLNSGKQQRSLDLKDADGRQDLLRLAAAADVLIEDMGAGGLEAHGLEAVLRRGAPGLVIVRISDFGQEGPYTDLPMTELTLQAAAGWIAGRGVLDREPLQAGGRVTEFISGAYAALAAITALGARTTKQAPVTVDLSRFESLLCTLSYPMLMHERMQRLGLPRQKRLAPLLGVLQASDGWVGINALTGQHWIDICSMMGLPEFEEHQYAVMFGGPERDHFFEAAERWVAARTAEEVLELSQAFRIPAAPVGNGEAILDFPQYRARGFFATYRGRDIEFTMPTVPYRLSATPAVAARPEASPPPTTPSSDTKSLFAGLRVVDLTTFWAGAYVGCYLGALGADVIKVESAHRPDGFRFSGAFPSEGERWYEQSGLWQGPNLNKRDITLDLATEEGRELLLRLVETADVVLESFTPRVMDNFGLTYERLQQTKNDIIMVRLPGFGLEGPWRDYVGWAFGIEQASGMAWVTGYADGPPTVLGGPADPIVGVHAGLALVAALEHRRRTGEGQLIEVAQIEVAACLTAEQVIAHSMNGDVLTREGNRHRHYVQGVYPVLGDDEWVAISIRDDDDWRRLISAMGSPDELTTPRFASAPDRRAAHDEIDKHITGWTASQEAKQVVDQLRAAGVPVAKVLVAAEMYDEPQLTARQFYGSFDNAVTGPRRFPGWPMQFSPHPYLRNRRGAPTLGEHNHEVLSELGLSEDEITQLEAQDVIGDRIKA